MSIENFERLVAPLSVDPDTRFCMEYLERAGKRFCVDFGFQNARQVASALALGHPLEPR